MYFTMWKLIELWSHRNQWEFPIKQMKEIEKKDETNQGSLIRVITFQSLWTKWVTEESILNLISYLKKHDILNQIVFLIEQFPKQGDKNQAQVLATANWYRDDNHYSNINLVNILKHKKNLDLLTDINNYQAVYQELKTRSIEWLLF